MMPENSVDNDEILYRRILAGRNHYKFRNDGIIEISSQAFYDPELRISVDRAKLCNNNPRHTLGNGSGVVSLVTIDVRSVVDLERKDHPGQVIERFKIDVEPVPVPNNSAHAEIHAIPEFTDVDKKRAFKRLCQRLARLAEARKWEILPTSE